MKLIIDVGNTHIVSTLVEHHQCTHSFRLPTAQLLTEDSYAFHLQSFLTFHQKLFSNIEKLLLCSVVPTVHKTFLRFAEKYHFSYFDVTTTTNLSVEIPYSVDTRGHDRVAVLEGIKKHYHTDSFIVVDMGTATTIDILKHNHYKGGAILAGYHTAYRALTDKAAMVEPLTLVATNQAYGITLSEQLGVHQRGYLHQIEGLINDILKEQGALPLFATGGLAKQILLTSSLSWQHDPLLLEKGILALSQRGEASDD